ncbi:hypothetical protein JST97_38530 [bacterium]|nr:hypothetical protein [bacterium]
MSIISHSISQLRARTAVSQQKLANGIQKSELEPGLVRYDLPTLGDTTPRQVFVEQRGWRAPELKAADAAGQEMPVKSRLEGFHRVYVVTGPGGNMTTFDPREGSLNYASPATDQSCQSIAGGMAHFRSWRRTTTQSLSSDGSLVVKSNQQIERDTFRGGTIAVLERCLLTRLQPGQAPQVQNYTSGIVQPDHRPGLGQLQGEQLLITDADGQIHQVPLYLEPPR